MDPGILAAWIGVGGMAAVTSVGGTIKWARGRIAKLTADHDAKTKELNRKIETLEQAADKQDEVIVDLRSQRDKLQITAELQDRFFGQLPPKRRESRD
jgi:hypothetical protein